MTCTACGAGTTEPFYRRAGVPVHSCLLLDDEEAARGFPRGDLILELCHGCGFIFNAAYDPAMSHYSPDYEETQGYSPHFQAFLAELAGRWVDDYGLQGGTVLEIGCGKGEFLAELVRHGVGEALGIDPGVHAERIPADVRDRVDVRRGFFPDEMPEIHADAVVCRHTLEHIGPVAEFMRAVRKSLGDRSDTVVLFELPDVLRVIREGAFWDVYYEHCSYFTLDSLERLFRRTGFEVLRTSMAYDDQYLLIEARPTGTGNDVGAAADDSWPSMFAMECRSFATNERRLVAAWRERITKIHEGGGRTVIWGSGSKGVAFLTALGPDARLVEYAVDINPHKHGKFLAGTAHLIVPPARLLEDPPELVIAMNPVYRQEIQRDLDQLGLAVVVEAL